MGLLVVVDERMTSIISTTASVADGRVGVFPSRSAISTHPDATADRVLYSLIVIWCLANRRTRAEAWEA